MYHIAPSHGTVLPEYQFAVHCACLQSSLSIDGRRSQERNNNSSDDTIQDYSRNDNLGFSCTTNCECKRNSDLNFDDACSICISIEDVRYFATTTCTRNSDLSWEDVLKTFAFFCKKKKVLKACGLYVD